MRRLVRLKLIVGTFLILASMSGWSACRFSRRFYMESALTNMVKIRKAEEALKLKTGRYGSLDELAASNLSVPPAAKYGYQFTVKGTSEGYKALAVPIRYPEDFRFYLDQSGIIRVTWRKEMQMLTTLQRVAKTLIQLFDNPDTVPLVTVLLYHRAHRTTR